MYIDKLKILAEISTGYSLRKSILNYKEGEVGLIQNKDICNDEVNMDKVSFIDISPRESLFLKKNDILLSSRGNFSASAVKEFTKKIVASSSFFVLQLNTKKILPEFLIFYLNSKEGQRKIRENNTGSVIKTILKKDLENIKILIPPIELQNKILKISSQSKKLKQLYEKKIQLQKENTEYILSNLLSQKII